jgi:hypothetical protein
MVELVELSLAGNCLSGPIPAAIGNLKKLTVRVINQLLPCAAFPLVAWN